MEAHSDKGRYIIALAVLESTEFSHDLFMLALECVIAYEGEKI